MFHFRHCFEVHAFFHLQLLILSSPHIIPCSYESVIFSVEVPFQCNITDYLNVLLILIFP
jgi:hypothetical protein